jgi:hypothetical protein
VFRILLKYTSVPVMHAFINFQRNTDDVDLKSPSTYSEKNPCDISPPKMPNFKMPGRRISRVS